jgi:YD repeat-containing protein
VTVTDLLREGRLEPVPPDVTTARASIEEAQRHLTSAALIAVDDPNGAYALLYDGARKAIAAHMLASGPRATVRPRAHHAVGV